MDIVAVLSALIFFMIGFVLFFIERSKPSRLEERNENLARMVEQAEKLRESGANASKKLPGDLTEKALEERKDRE